MTSPHPVPLAGTSTRLGRQATLVIGHACCHSRLQMSHPSPSGRHRLWLALSRRQALSVPATGPRPGGRTSLRADLQRALRAPVLRWGGGGLGGGGLLGGVQDSKWVRSAGTTGKTAFPDKGRSKCLGRPSVGGPEEQDSAWVMVSKGITQRRTHRDKQVRERHARMTLLFLQPVPTAPCHPARHGLPGDHHPLGGGGQFPVTRGSTDVPVGLGAHPGWWAPSRAPVPPPSVCPHLPGLLPAGHPLPHPPLLPRSRLVGKPQDLKAASQGQEGRGWDAAPGGSRTWEEGLTRLHQVRRGDRDLGPWEHKTSECPRNEKVWKCGRGPGDRNQPKPIPSSPLSLNQGPRTCSLPLALGRVVLSCNRLTPASWAQGCRAGGGRCGGRKPGRAACTKPLPPAATGQRSGRWQNSHDYFFLCSLHPTSLLRPPRNVRG